MPMAAWAAAEWAEWAGWICKRDGRAQRVQTALISRRYAENSNWRRVLARLQRDQRERVVAQRAAVRQARSAPITGAFHSSRTAGVTREPAREGSLPLRGRHSPFVFGRKGWLFSDTIHVAVASAKLYFLVETAKNNGVEVHNYLSRLFERVPHLRLIGFSRCKSKPACRMR